MIGEHKIYDGSASYDASDYDEYDGIRWLERSLIVTKIAFLLNSHNIFAQEKFGAGENNFSWWLQSWDRTTRHRTSQAQATCRFGGEESRDFALAHFLVHLIDFIHKGKPLALGVHTCVHAKIRGEIHWKSWLGVRVGHHSDGGERFSHFEVYQQKSEHSLS